MILLDFDYHVISVHTRRDALREIKRRNIPLALVDFRMPGKGELGTLELIEKMKSLRPDMSIICMTGLRSTELKDKVKCLEAVELIDMPFQLEKLLKLVREKVTDERVASSGEDSQGGKHEKEIIKRKEVINRGC